MRGRRNATLHYPPQHDGVIGNDPTHYTTYSPTMVSVELLVNLGFVITQMFAQLRETKFLVCSGDTMNKYLLCRLQEDNANA